MAEPILPVAPTADELAGAIRAMDAMGDFCALRKNLQWMTDGAAQVADLDSRRATAQKTLQDKQVELDAADAKIALAAQAAGMSLGDYKAALDKVQADITAAKAELGVVQGQLSPARQELSDIQKAIDAEADDIRTRLPAGWVLVVPPLVPGTGTGTGAATIALNDATNPLDVVQPAVYSEQGATSSDGALVSISGDTDFTTVGKKHVFYDAPGAPRVDRVVNVVAATGGSGNGLGSITLLPDANPITLKVGDTFSDPGFTAANDSGADAHDLVIVTGNVDTSTPGTDTLTYALGALVVTRTVIVTDAAQPAARRR